MNASLLMPAALLLLSLACCIGIIREVAFGRYGQAIAGLLWGAILIVATMMSARPLLALLDSAI
jgi:hypothetical protein